MLFLVWMLCHILSRHLAFCQCGISSYVFKVPFCVNVLSHFEQTCGFLPVWISSCVFKYAFCVNVLSHFEQACGFWPVWITSCFFKCVFCENALSHFEQALKRWKAKWDKNQQKNHICCKNHSTFCPKSVHYWGSPLIRGNYYIKKGQKVGRQEIVHYWGGVHYFDVHYCEGPLYWIGTITTMSSHILES